MNKYDELVKALRYCIVERPCSLCPRYEEGTECFAKLHRDAAAAIEELQAENETLHQHIQDLNEAFRAESKRRQELENEPLQVGKAGNKYTLNEPKRGEWMLTDAFPHRVFCSKCYKTYVPNDRWQIWVDNELPRNYCPNCGAKMEVQDGQ